MKEIWKEIKNLEGYYASNLGRIKSKYGNILKGSITNAGYRNVSVFINGKWTSKKISRLIAKTFIPNPKNKPYIDHINTIRDDDRVENLRWVTPKENMRNPITYQRILSEVMKPERLKNLNQKGMHFSEEHKRKIGLANKRNKGCGWARKSVICVETGIVYESMTEAYKKTRVHASSIGKVCSGERKTAGKKHWNFV